MRLEELLGAQLFERDRRKVLLSDKGKEALGMTRSVLEAVDALVGAMRRGGDQLAGTLRLGVIPTIAPHLVPRFLPALAAQHPQARLLLREDLTARLVAMVQAAELDAILVDVDADLANLQSVRIFDDAFLLAVPHDHPLAKREQVTLAEVEVLELMLLEDGHCLSDRVRSFCSHHDDAGFCNFRATSLVMLVYMVASGEGATLLPEMAARDFRTVPNLVLVPIVDPAPFRRIGIAYRASDGRAESFGKLAGIVEQSA